MIIEQHQPSESHDRTQEVTPMVISEVSELVSSIAAKKGVKRAKTTAQYHTAHFVLFDNECCIKSYTVPVPLVPHFGTLKPAFEREVDLIINPEFFDPIHLLLLDQYPLLKQISSRIYCAGADNQELIVQFRAMNCSSLGSLSGGEYFWIR